MTHQKKALLAAFLGEAIFGFSFLFTKIALEVTTPFVLLATRFLLAFIVMTVVALVTGKLHLRSKRPLRLVVLGLLQPVAYFLFESYGIELTNSSYSGTIISLATIVTFFLGALILKERFTIKQLLWACCSVCGVALVTLFAGGGGSITLSGTLLLLGAVVTTSLFSVLSRRWAQEFSAFERTYVMFGVGSAAFLIGALIETQGGYFALLPSLIFEPRFILPLLYLAVLSSIAAFMLINYSVTHIEARKALMFASISTVISILAGVLILGEPFSIVQGIGSVLVLLGVYKVSMANTAKKKVAFICVHNSCRSQIAEALGKHLRADEFDFYSAGTQTKPQINADAVRLMKQLYGIDMEQTQYSKTIDKIPAPDIAVSMGCDVGCPYIGREFDENWGLQDPTGQSDEVFIEVIKEIEDKIMHL